jgi:hypothetical protein
MMPPPSKREAHSRALAERLEFTVEQTGDFFRLTRTASDSRPVRQEGLTLEQPDELLNEWNLRGFHGG